MTSNVDISFSQDPTITPPVNPTDPTSPVTPNPTDPHQPGTGGPLSLDYVSNFHFGTKVIQTADATYYAQTRLSSKFTFYIDQCSKLCSSNR